MDIIKDTEFSDSNVCFKAALAELKRIGKGSVVHHPVINEPGTTTYRNPPRTYRNPPCVWNNPPRSDIYIYNLFRFLCRF